ncbi:MAG TPA: SHOCT domain-containing protein [Acidimicrobiales bacterium]|jgi:hypothetical protein
MLGVTWGTGQVVLDMLWFFLFVVEIWLIVTVFVDIFRRHDMKGWLKAFWVVFVVVVPLAGIVLYLIIYGSEMRVHALQAARRQEATFGSSGVPRAGGSGGLVDDLHRLVELRERGVITDEEFDRIKGRILDV